MYIFRFPARVPLMTYGGLTDWISKGRDPLRRKIGTTVTVDRADVPERHICIYLYDTIIARLYPDGRVIVSEAVNNWPRQATTEWLALILWNNGLSGHVGREGGRYRQAGQIFTAGEPRPARWQEVAA